MKRILYLHGFASGPGSRKARFFRERLEAAGRRVEIPDLAEGDFRGLTISGQLRLVEKTAAGEAVTLIGSSMGGYIAALYAARHREVERLILLAPAFNFYERWLAALDAATLDRWRREGELPVFHYAEGREMPIGYQLIEDAKQYEAFPEVQEPALLFHGNQDTVVPVEFSEQFVAARASARLVRLESGHELTDVLETVWTDSAPFLQATGGG